MHFAHAHFLVTYRRASQNGSSVSSSLSFESASSRCCTGIEEKSTDFQSAEDLLDNVIATAGCTDFFKSTYLETHFDDFFEDPKPSSSEPDQDVVSNFAIDLMHGSNSVDSGSTCRTPSEPKNVTFNPQVVNIERATPEASPKPRWRLLPLRRSRQAAPKPVVSNEQVPKTILCKRRGSEEEFFARTEALPLLSGLGGAVEKTSPSFVRRKKYVYPAVTVVGKGESSV